MSYAVIGASGHTGRRVAEKLLEAGREVRAIARTAERLAPLAKKGAQICAGSIADPAFLAGVFQGVSGVYAMIPPDLSVPDVRAYYARRGDSIAAALQAACVTHVVNLSSQGAALPDKTGPIAGLHEQEERLNRCAGLSVVHLRPTFFMENLLQHVPGVKDRGEIASPLRGDLPLAMIATRDIGDVAAAHLLALDFRGQSVHDLLGPHDLTMNEVARILGKVIGRPALKYVQADYADAEQGMRAAGISAGVAAAFVEMYRAFNDGLIVRLARTAANTTPTTLETFAAVFAEAVGAWGTGGSPAAARLGAARVGPGRRVKRRATDSRRPRMSRR